MDATLQAVLAAMLYLAVKHLVADFVLQSAYQYKNKGIYGHPGGLLHAGIHGALSVPVFWILPMPAIAVAAAVIAAEFIVHYHVDWMKERIVRMRALGPDTSNFWRLLGFDQFVHHATYVTMIWAVLRFGAG